MDLQFTGTGTLDEIVFENVFDDYYNADGIFVYTLIIILYRRNNFIKHRRKDFSNEKSNISFYYSQILLNYLNESTLTSSHSLFSNLFSNPNASIKPNSRGQYFFDRDPTHFRIILNFLRTSKIVLPESKRELQELLLESEFYSLESLRESVQKALDGLRFEETFKWFHITKGNWELAPIKTYTQLDIGRISAHYMGLPQNFQPIVLEGESIMRMSNILGPMERRAMCTCESFGVDAERTEVKIRTMSKENKPVPTNRVPFEIFLWNQSSDEYIGIYLSCDANESPNLNVNIVCHEGGHNKEKIVENAWKYDEEVTIFVRDLKAKTEVQICGCKRKTFHVPVPLERLAPYHIVIGQRTGNISESSSIMDICLCRVAVFGSSHTKGRNENI